MVERRCNEGWGIKIDDLQKQTCLSTTEAIHTTPTATMEALRLSVLYTERVEVKGATTDNSILDMISVFSNHDLNGLVHR